MAQQVEESGARPAPGPHAGSESVLDINNIEVIYEDVILVLRGLSHYWRTNLAVVVGVATAVATLAGALLVGDSVRGSLRDLVLQFLHGKWVA